jgi:hypothetical protein
MRGGKKDEEREKKKKKKKKSEEGRSKKNICCNADAKKEKEYVKCFISRIDIKQHRNKQ